MTENQHDRLEVSLISVSTRSGVRTAFKFVSILVRSIVVTCNSRCVPVYVFM